MLGLSPAAIDQLTPSDLRLAIIARYKYDERRDRSEWERARIQAWFTTAPHLKKGVKQKPSDLIPLPWDNGESKGVRPTSVNGLRDYYRDELKRMKDG